MAAVDEGEEVQIVVAEHAREPLGQAAQEAQRRQRIRAAVDQISNAPQRIRAAEGHLFQ